MMFLFVVLLLLAHESFCTATFVGDDTTKISFNKCFAGVDTTKQVRAEGCYNTFYKIIDKKYVLSIKLDTIPAVGSCLNIVELKAVSYFVATLSVYDKNRANLYNICTDVVVVNNARPSRNLVSKRGVIVIGVSGTSNYYGRETAVVSILVKRITFYDKRLDKNVIIENELLWKKLNVLSEQG